MKPADAFRNAANSFSGREFTKEELKLKYYSIVDGGASDTHFTSYFSNFKRQPYKGLQIVPGVAGGFKAVTTIVPPGTTATRRIKPVIKYPNPIPHYPVFHRFVRANGLSVLGDLVLLQDVNAAKVEGLIAYDPNYRPKALRLYESFCRKDKKGNPIHSTFDFRNAAHVLAVIQQIDDDNSTFDAAITASGRYPLSACQSFCNYICDPTNSFLSELDGNVATITALVEKMRLSHPYYNAKSLASKVCKYFHEFYYGNDKFFINDKVVRSMLPYYLDYYGVSHSLFTPSARNLLYPDLYNYLEQLRNAALTKHGGRPLKRSELDHILWYCYKMFKNKEL